MSRKFFYSLLFLYVVSLVYVASTLPIGPHEAMDYYTDTTFLHYLTHFFTGLFGTILDVRLPFLLFGFLNIVLFFRMSRVYFVKEEESHLATMIFVLLPGIITSAILVNISVVVITLVLSFILFYEKKQVIGQVIVMILLLLIHDASIIFFISLAIFSGIKRDTQLFILSMILSLISLLYFNELTINGKPKGEFLELFGLYVALFSPLVFIYFFYALYRILVREAKDILWYISFTAFVLSIVLSLRQQVIMTDFAPYVIVSVVLMVVSYYRTLYIRLPQFQKGYRMGFRIVIASLVLSTLVLIFHQVFFCFLKDKSKHFAYAFYEPYWKVLELHQIEKNCYTVERKKVQYQFKYYGIEECNDSTVPKIHK
jgi:hypothetical protein